MNKQTLINRINDFLIKGGFFNPEHMEIEQLNRLLLDVRDYLNNIDDTCSPRKIPSCSVCGGQEVYGKCPRVNCPHANHLTPQYYGAHQTNTDNPIDFPPCRCYTCLRDVPNLNGKFPLTMTTFIGCKECGNKRCPKATDHRLECTNSNEPGQPGSRVK